MREYNILTQFLKNNTIVTDENIYYSEMIYDANHPYYFEHANDHLPGMMLIEAVRQFLVAIIHIFGNVPTEGYHIILNKMDVQFSNYIEFYMPLTLKATMINLSPDKSKMWPDPIFNVEVHQNNIMKSKMSFNSSIIAHKHYNRIRRKGLKQASLYKEGY